MKIMKVIPGEKRSELRELAAAKASEAGARLGGALSAEAVAEVAGARGDLLDAIATLDAIGWSPDQPTDPVDLVPLGEEVQGSVERVLGEPPTWLDTATVGE